MSSIKSRAVLIGSLCVLMLSVNLNLLAQQGDQAEFRQRIAGTWSLDLKKCEEYLEEEAFQRLPNGADGVKMIFAEDGSLQMVRNHDKRDVTYELTPVAESDTEFKCRIAISDREMNAIITFLEANTIKVAPTDDETPAILTRSPKQLTLEEATSTLLGKWTCDVKATKKLLGDDYTDDMEGFAMQLNDDGSVEVSEEGHAAPTGTYEISEIESSSEEVASNRFSLVIEVNGASKDFVVQIGGTNEILVIPDGQPKIVFARDKE